MPNTSHDSDDHLPLVLVTGASGFVALHCVRRLLEGPYRVRGTVRSKKNTQKIAPLLRLPHASEKLELVEADLLVPNNWTQVVSGCSYILHVASPWLITATSEIVATAVEGTLTVLAAANECPEVKKVVLTSSCAAVNDGHKNSSAVFDETFWTDIESKRTEWYGVSKTLAERAAWDYWNGLDVSSRFSLTVLNPTLVFGPVLSDVDHGCATILARMMKRTTNLAQPKVSLGLVDVRDVAEAHVRCLERPETDGERILVTASPSAWYADIARWLNQEFGRYDYGISTWECPNWLLKIYAASGLDPQSKAVVRRRGSELRFDNTKSIRLLDMKYRSVDKAVVEMMHTMIEMGMVKGTKKYEATRRRNPSSCLS
ncbi:hypothetical protein PENTCL1PPCAC_26265 [Pristionchus entomophagus]|uniref:NAD-dependent epimerase/dehydratase domain-containing protein n=1 Tax=Pristionchus entomophagus TaxID=358040 RepID=A0AAV5UB25_9BILA|nr:hypothetical protein PENTCL1PPCAC_26265 [Pristionchus entomophagus]